MFYVTHHSNSVFRISYKYQVRGKVLKSFVKSLTSSHESQTEEKSLCHYGARFGYIFQEKMVVGPFILLYSDLETIKCTVEEKVGWEIAETSKNSLKKLEKRK